MSNDISATKQQIQDQFESQIKTAAAKLDTLKANAQATQAKAIAALQPEKQAIQQKVNELKKSAGDQWEQAKSDLQGRIADFQKSVQRIESKAKAS